MLWWDFYQEYQGWFLVVGVGGGGGKCYHVGIVVGGVGLLQYLKVIKGCFHSNKLSK